MAAKKRPGLFQHWISVCGIDTRGPEEEVPELHVKERKNAPRMPAMSKGYIIEASSYHLVLRPLSILVPNIAKAESFKGPGIRVHIIIKMVG